MRGFLLAVIVALAGVAAQPVRAQPDAVSADQMTQRVDQLLGEAWQRDGVVPAEPASDAEFLRRASLDLTGVIPRVAKVRYFLASEESGKRSGLVDELLDSPRFSTHLASTWSGFILPSDFDPQRLDRAVSLQNWLRRKFMSNLRYDRIVAEFLSATGTVEVGPTIFYQELESKPEKLAARTSQLFLGVQMQCAECHDHPFDDWSQKDFWGYAAFFAQLPPVDETPGSAFRLVDLPDGDVTLPDSDEVIPPQYPNGEMADPNDLGSRRQQLAIWIAARDNPFLARATVNRVWAHLFGQGIVHPVDDMSRNNPPSHPELLNELSDYFVQSGFDLRQLIRVLAKTRAYQASSRSAGGPRTPQLFERMSVKRMTPDQMFDSLQQTIGVPTALSGPQDPGRREFLVRMRSSARDATDYDLGLQQVLRLMNGPQVALITDARNGGILAALRAPFFDDAARVDVLFLATLSRYPREDEKARFVSYLASGSGDENQLQPEADVLWALINSAEYQLNH